MEGELETVGVVGREVVTGVGTGGRTLTAGPEEGFVALDSVTGKGAKSINETVSSRPPGYLTFAFEGLTETRSSEQLGQTLDYSGRFHIRARIDEWEPAVFINEY